MSYFKTSEVTRVVLPSNSEYWVDVLANFTWGQVKQLASVKEDGSTNLEIAGDKFLLMAIKSWNLDDEDGNIVEVNTESIDRLEKDDVLAIIDCASGVIKDGDSKKN